MKYDLFDSLEKQKIYFLIGNIHKFLNRFLLKSQRLAVVAVVIIKTAKRTNEWMRKQGGDEMSMLRSIV